APAVGGQAQARHVAEREHHLVGALVAGVRDAPDAVAAADVTVVVVGRAAHEQIVLGDEHGVGQVPGAGGDVAGDVDLRLVAAVLGDDVRVQGVAQEGNERLPRLELQILAVGGGRLGDHGVGELVPVLGVQAAQVAVLEPADGVDVGEGRQICRGRGGRGGFGRDGGFGRGDVLGGDHRFVRSDEHAS